MEFRPMEASAVRVAAHGFAYRRTGGGRGQRVLLWIATAISIALWALPHVIR